MEERGWESGRGVEEREQRDGEREKGKGYSSHKHK